MTGTCLCGGIRVDIAGKVGPVVYCHCTQCRKANGSAFAANADVRSQYWTLATGAELVREYESSPGKYRAFCGRCGSPIYSRQEDRPGVFRVRLGILDADPERRALAHFWVRNKAPWFEITDALPRFTLGTAEHADEIMDMTSPAVPRKTP